MCSLDLDKNEKCELKFRTIPEKQIKIVFILLKLNKLFYKKS
jgi:hypothetical protein